MSTHVKLLTLAVSLMSACTIVAQTTVPTSSTMNVAAGEQSTAISSPAYTVNVAAEEKAADSEYSFLRSRASSSPLVPHLNPAKVAVGMANRQFSRNGTTPFTFVIAHRGAHTAPNCPENSSCGIDQAYRAGADGIELDVKVTADQGPVLGHDNGVARELYDWIDSNGIIQFSGQNRLTWTPFNNFPVVDYVYQNLTQYPFLQNTAGLYDTNNPPRSAMTVSQLQGMYLFDTYNYAQSSTQLTLFQGLYLIHKYAPMMIWLDVKSAADLASVGSVIKVARSAGLGPGPLDNISLKLDWGTVKTLPGGNPGAAMGNPGNIFYFLVFGTGNLDEMATWNNQPTPTSPSQLANQVLNTINQFCTVASGCLGVEISHKYQGAPTQGIYDLLSSSTSVPQIAAFQTLPQYSWYWSFLQSQKAQATTYGRTFPRTDGSCCFALTDSLNISQYAGPEMQDLRGTYSWNELNFSTITTDEPLLVLRDLTANPSGNLRPVSTAMTYFGSTQIQSGGHTYAGQPRDGLYYVQNAATGQYLAIDNNNKATMIASVPTSSVFTNLRSTWYISSISSNAVNVASAGYNGFYLYYGPNGSGQNALSLGFAGSGTSLSFTVPLYSGNTNSLIPANASGNSLIPLGGNSFSVGPPAANSSWIFIPVSTPVSEQRQQQQGPPGYVFCADGDVSPTQTCNFTGAGAIAYGANGSFRNYDYISGPFSCQLSSFGNVDPAPGVGKACFYAPYDSTGSLDSSFNYSASEGQYVPFEGYATVAFGTNADGNPRYAFSTAQQGYTCSTAYFGFDPASGQAKSCYLTANNLVTPTGYSFCAAEGNYCAFAQTAMVAFGFNGNFTYKLLANGAACSRTTFGLDPAPNAGKACFVLSTPLNPVSDGAYPPGLQQCATDGGTCSNIPAGALVGYGAFQAAAVNSTYKQLSGTFSCSTSTFGYDPAPGKAKTCSWIQLPIASRGPAGFSYCATEGETCNFGGVAQIAFGLDGNFTYLPKATNGVSCQASAFPNNPYQGVVRACFYRLY